MEKAERFLLCGIALWFAVISLIVLSSLWSGPVTLHETNKAILALEVGVAALIGLFGLLAYARLVRSMVRRARRPRLHARTRHLLSLRGEQKESVLPN